MMVYYFMGCTVQRDISFFLPQERRKILLLEHTLRIELPSGFDSPVLEYALTNDYTLEG
jgi:hypothetical protein